MIYHPTRVCCDLLKSRLRPPDSEIVDWRALAVEEWFEGVAAVRENIALVDTVNTYHEAFADEELSFQATAVAIQ